MDGVDDYASIGAITFGGQNLTITFFANYKKVANYARIMDFGQG